MMEETNQILLSLGLDITDANVTMEQLKKELKEARKEMERAAIGSKEFEKASAKVKNLSGAVNTLGKSAKDTRNSLGGINEATKHVAGSFDELEANIKKGKKELNSLVIDSEEYRKKLAEVVALEEKRRQVLKDRPSVLSDRISQGINQSKQGQGGGMFGGAGNMLGKAGVYGAIAAGVLAGGKELISFMGLDDIEDSLDSGLTAIKTFFKNILMAAYNELGKVKDIMTAVFTGDFTSAKILFKSLGDEMSKATSNAIAQGKEAYKIQMQLKQLEDEERQAATDTSNAMVQLSNARVAALKKQGDQVQANIDLAIKEANVAQDIAQKEVDLANRKIELTKALIAAENKGVRTEMSDSQKEKLQDLEIARNEKILKLNSAIAAFREKLQNRQDALDAKNAKKQEDNLAAQKKNEEDAVKEKQEAERLKQQAIEATAKLEEDIERMRIQRIENRQERELAMLAFETELRKKSINNSLADAKTKQEALLMIEQDYANRKAEIEKQAAARVSSEWDTFEQMQIENMAEGAEKQMALLDFETKKKKEAINATVTDELAKAMQLNEVNNAYEKKKTEIALQEEAKRRALAFETADSVVSSMRSVADIMGKSAQFSKAIGMVEMMVNIAKALSAAKVAAAANPLNGVTGGLAGLATYATMAAQIMGSVAQFKQLMQQSVPTPGFIKGGYTGEGIGIKDAQGYEIAGVVHPREYVLNEAQTKDFFRSVNYLTSQMNGKAKANQMLKVDVKLNYDSLAQVKRDKDLQATYNVL